MLFMFNINCGVVWEVENLNETQFVSCEHINGNVSILCNDDEPIFVTQAVGVFSSRGGHVVGFSLYVCWLLLHAIEHMILHRNIPLSIVNSLNAELFFEIFQNFYFKHDVTLK